MEVDLLDGEGSSYVHLQNFVAVDSPTSPTQEACRTRFTTYSLKSILQDERLNVKRISRQHHLRIVSTSIEQLHIPRLLPRLMAAQAPCFTV
jgi:hypothetical protein